MMRWVVSITLLICFITTPAYAFSTDETESDLLYDLSHVVITEVQTATEFSASEEFIELYNPTDLELDLAEFEIQYKSANGEDWLTKAAFDLLIQPRGHLLMVSAEHTNDELFTDADVFFAPGLAGNGGHLRLIEKISTGEGVDELIVHDLLGWGDADSPEFIASDKPEPGQSLKRIVNEDGNYLDSNDNSLDWFISSEPSPESDSLQEADEPEEDTSHDEDNHNGEIDEEEPGEVPNYLPIEITELFIDPAHPLSDADDEFIELHNPHNTPVDLEGYVIETGSSFSHDLVLPEIVLAPDQYLVLYSADTNLPLANSGGGARLLNPNGTVVFQTDIYSDVDENTSWALFDAGWEFTLEPTPAEPNILLKPVAQEPRTSSSGRDLKPCNADQYRNPATNRCKKYEDSSPSTLKPCEAGQYRNPETNRCKKISTGETSLKPCAGDQYRNPATNRCKKYEVVSSKQADNATQSAQSPSVKGAVDQIDNSSANYWLVGGTGALASTYALYEYRFDVRNHLRRLRSFFARGKLG